MIEGACAMSKYVDNVNAYMSQMKIKQNYISLKTGIDKNKLSRILNGKQGIDSTDMEKIANALGYKTEYFLSENFAVPVIGSRVSSEIAFYVGEPTKEQQDFAMKLVDFIENVDEVLGAEGRFMNALMG